MKISEKAVEVKILKHNKSKSICKIDEWEIDEDEIDYNAKQIIRNNEEKTMSVMKMGKILGLHKTDSYWLAHKNFFKIIEVSGQMRIDIESFENWYKHQIKYQKVDGSPPGEILKEESYSAKDIAEILQISEERAYAALKRDCVPYIIVDYWKRWTKSDFEEWYKSQSKYRTKKDRESDLNDIERTLSMPEMRFLLGVHRNTVYDILNRSENKNIFEIVIVAEQKRITKESFLNWYNGQNKYIMLYDSIEDGQQAKSNIAVKAKYDNDEEKTENSTENQDSSDKKRSNILSEKSSNPDYYSINEVIEVLGKKRRTVLKMIRENIIQAIPVAGSYRIPKLEFDRWLIEKQELSESEVDTSGINN